MEFHDVERDENGDDVFSGLLEGGNSQNAAPKPLEKVSPFLVELATGFVFVYTEALAQRSDLVTNAYNKEGSLNPEDADPSYDPSGMYRDNSRPLKAEDIGPRNMAESQAENLRLKKRIQELEAKERKTASTKNDGTESSAQSEVPAYFSDTVTVEEAFGEVMG